MRQKLAERAGQDVTLIGTLARAGRRGDTHTLLFRHITEPSGAPIADHLWLPYSSAFEGIDFAVGDRLCFTGRVVGYAKGVGYNEDDFGLADVRDVALRNEEMA